jgi:hypothetical protein
VGRAGATLQRKAEEDRDELIDLILWAAQRARREVKLREDTPVRMLLHGASIVYRIVRAYFPTYSERISGVAYDEDLSGVEAKPSGGKSISITVGRAFVLDTEPKTLKDRVAEVGEALGAPESLKIPEVTMTGGVFSESPDEKYAGYDASEVPNWLVVPSGESRKVKVSAPNSLNFAVKNPGVARVKRAGGGIRIYGDERDCDTVVHAREEGKVVDELRIAVRKQIVFPVYYFFVRDTAGHGTELRDPGQMHSALDFVWKKQANIRFRMAGRTIPHVVAGDLGSEVDLFEKVRDEDSEETYRSYIGRAGEPGQLNVFILWDLEGLRGFTDGWNLFIEDGAARQDPALVLAHEVGHSILRAGHDGWIDVYKGIMKGKPGTWLDPRVPKEYVDRVLGRKPGGKWCGD